MYDYENAGEIGTEENKGTRCGLPRICVFHKPVVPSRQVSSVFPERRKTILFDSRPCLVTPQRHWLPK